jgi:type I restriction enzyme S subunit
MSLHFKFIPLTFLKDENEVRKQIRNTVILKHFFDKNEATIKLNNVIEGTQYGYNASAQESGKNKFLRISDITDGKVDWSSVPFCDCNDEATYLLNSGDLLIARTGGTTGKSFLISSPPKSSIYAGYLIRIRANKENRPEFINLFLNSYVYWSQIISLNKGEFRPSINANKLKDLIFPHCNSKEQEDAIKLSKGDRLIGYKDLEVKIERALKDYNFCKSILSECFIQKTNSKLLHQSILKEAIEGKLSESWREHNTGTESASDLFNIISKHKLKLIEDRKIKKEKSLQPILDNSLPFLLPNGWTWCRLGDLCSKTGSGSTPRGGKSAYVDKGIKFIRSQNVYDDGLRLADIVYITDEINEKMKGSKVKPNDLLLNITGGSIGRCCIVNSDFDEGNINQHVAIIRPILPTLVEYLHTVICSSYFQNEILNVQTGAGREGLPKNKMDNILIPLPPTKEQGAINNRIRLVKEQLTELKEEILNSETEARKLTLSVINESF